MVWAPDKAGEWADAGLIRPVEVLDEFSRKFFPKAWQAVLHRGSIWGYPIGLETVTLMYNKNLISSPPTDLAQLLLQRFRNSITNRNGGSCFAGSGGARSRSSHARKMNSRSIRLIDPCLNCLGRKNSSAFLVARARDGENSRHSSSNALEIPAGSHEAFP